MFENEENEDFLTTVKERFKNTIEAWDKNYKMSIDEINFLNPYNQFPEEVKSNRVGKPTIASDRLNAQVKQICNQQRDNRPAITIHAVNNDADEETANVIQGIIRHIEYSSKADLAYDTAFEHAVQGGIGFVRLLTDYEENSFDQKLMIEEIANPFMIYVDPTFKKIDGSDIEYAFILDLMTREEFKRTYPESKMAQLDYNQWQPLASRFPEWFDIDKKSTIVCEYFVKEYKKGKLVKLSDGRVLDKADCNKKELKQIVDERENYTPTIKWYKLCCEDVLEETEWLGKFIPVIPVFGDILLDNGNRIFSGLVRNNKETQVMLNTVKTVILEMIAKAPKNPWLVAEGSVDDHKDEWAQVNILDLPYLTYKTKLEGMEQGEQLPIPQRQTAEPPIQGMLAVVQTLENDIKATSAIFDPTLGEKMANDQSGVAIKALQQAGNTAHYNYSDNLSRALRVIGHQILDLLPKIYPERKVIRIVGLDDKHKLVTINGMPENNTDNEMTIEGVQKIYDITTGEYDVTVDTGPSYQTRRQENLNMLVELVKYNPNSMQFVMDKLVGLMDFPEMVDIKKRFEKMLPPQLQEDQNKQADPQALQQQLDQAHQMLQQMTQVLQKETTLANTEQTKLQIAQIQAQTELTKHQNTLSHDANKLTLQAELEEIRAKNERTHDMMLEVHKHLFNKDLATHETVLGALSAPPTPETAQTQQPQNNGVGM